MRTRLLHGHVTENVQSDWLLQDLGACSTLCIREVTRPSFFWRLKDVACETRCVYNVCIIEGVTLIGAVSRAVTAVKMQSKSQGTS